MKKALITTTTIIVILGVSLTILYGDVSSIELIKPSKKNLDKLVIEETKSNYIKLYEDDDTGTDVVISPEEESKVIFNEEKEEVKIVLPKKLEYQNISVELPLYAEDYYYGKHVNASVAASEIDSMPKLEPGDRVSIIENGYLTFDSSKGYIKPGSSFHYASGVCWTTSALGFLMDEANKEFQKKYSIPLFIFEQWDRYGHKKTYKTYTGSNYGYGYSVAKDPSGKIFDYRFTVNPEIDKIPELEGFKLHISMKGVTNHSWGYNGESIEGTIVSNSDW